MGFEIKKEKLCSCLSTVDSAEYNLEKQINLPDYCSDIKRILKCNITPSVSSVSILAGKATVKGSAVIRTVYIGEKDKIDCCEITEGFTATCSLSEQRDNATVSVRAKVNYVNCRATSQRRVTVSASIGMNLTTHSEKNCDIIMSAQGEGMQIKTDTVLADNVVCISRKVFEMSETACVPSDKEPVGKVLSVRNYAVIDSKKAVSGKLLIKGELYTTIIYCAEDREKDVQKFRHSMPISQIIDVPGIDDECMIELSADVVQSGTVVKSDSSGENRLIEIAARVQTVIKGTKKEKYTVIDECYCTDYDINAYFETREFSRIVHCTDRQLTVKSTVEMPAPIRQVCCIWPCEISCDMDSAGNKASGKGTATFGIIYVDEKGNRDYCEKKADFDFDETLNEKYGKLFCNCTATVRDVEYDSVQKDRLTLTAQIGITADIYCKQEMKILSSAELLKDKPKKRSDAALVIYFSQRNERIWDIAKKYNTTVEAIMSENDLEEEKTKEEMMLMIPCR